MHIFTGPILVNLIFRKDGDEIFPVQAGDPGVLVVCDPDILDYFSEAPAKVSIDIRRITCYTALTIQGALAHAG